VPLRKSFVTIGPAEMLRVSLEDGTQSDPLKLKQFIQSPEYLETLGKNRKLLEFYERQNALISTFLGGPGVFGDKEDEQLRLRIAVYGSFAANLCLFCLQLTAAILSKSLGYSVN
jgi:capsule polysaccharide export protein KpsE/RkpR